MNFLLLFVPVYFDFDIFVVSSYMGGANFWGTKKDVNVSQVKRSSIYLSSFIFKLKVVSIIAIYLMDQLSRNGA